MAKDAKTGGKPLNNIDKANAEAKAAAKARADAKAKAAAAGEAGEAAPKKLREERVIPRLQQHYRETVRAELLKEFGYKNPLEVPRLEKIVINMGVGEAAADQKKLDAAVAELTLIAGQRPVKTVAKKAIAGFKIREGLPIGTKVTLRKARMYEFLDRLVTIAMPRVRDFRGIPNNKGFDGRGNFAMGLKEQIIFPEIVYDKVDAIRGMDIIFVTTAKTDAEAKALLTGFSLPFAKV